MKNRLCNSILFLVGAMFLTTLSSVQAAMPSSNTEIKPRSAFAETELGRLIEQAHQANSLAVINALKGKDVHVVANFFATCVTHDVSPRICFDLLQRYMSIVKSNCYTFFMNPYIENLYHKIINDILQQAVISGKFAYISYFITHEECRQHISLTHLKNAMQNLPACRNDYIRASMKLLLQKYYDQKIQEEQLLENMTSCITCPLCTLVFDFIFNR
ncbi:MAG: hypothetical protein WC365_04045 [Candidatus Babeliales bacterium]|jgi:hypothetical protein